MIPAWIEATRDAEIPPGLDVDEALKRAVSLRKALRSGTASPADFAVDIESVETLHSLCALLDQTEETDPKVLLADTAAAFEYISALDWPAGGFGGRTDLITRLCFLCWRYARHAQNVAAESNWRGIFSTNLSDKDGIGFAANRALATPASERASAAPELRLDDPEQLLAVCELLHARGETTPAVQRADAEFFYSLLERSTRQIGTANEREYFLGEFALMAGSACRLLRRREEAQQWFERSEASFLLSHNSNAHIARLAYQRLALAIEERDFRRGLEGAPLLHANLVRLGLRVDAVKSRFLLGIVLWETGQLDDALALFDELEAEALSLGNEKLRAQAGNNAAMICSALGRREEALRRSREALPLFRKLQDRVGLVKLQWGIANLLRGEGKTADALEAFRGALREAEKVGLRGDVAALHVVVADLLLDAGMNSQAEVEIRAALPIIEEEQMGPEGMAALSLLRESLRRRQINRQALRDLHGYFRDSNS